MYDGEFTVKDQIDPGHLLERFLSDCQRISDDIDSEDYTLAYMADTVAAIFYYREYNSCEDFLYQNQSHIDNERSEWVKYMWRTLDTMTDSQRADVVIESLSQMPATL
jgi:hypothetical protein